MIIPYQIVREKHIWQVYVTSELKAKLFCFFTIRAMVWIFIAVKNMFKSFGCTKIRDDSKWTKSSQSEVMQLTTSSSNSRPIFPYHIQNQAGFDNSFINGRNYIYSRILNMSFTF